MLDVWGNIKYNFESTGRHPKYDAGPVVSEEMIF
jgi:hypothetical protein